MWLIFGNIREAELEPQKRAFGLLRLGAEVTAEPAQPGMHHPAGATRELFSGGPPGAGRR